MIWNEADAFYQMTLQKALIKAWKQNKQRVLEYLAKTSDAKEIESYKASIEYYNKRIENAKAILAKATSENAYYENIKKEYVL